MKPWLRSRAALRWVALGLVIGAVSGGLAVAFEETLLFGTHLLLGLAGYQPATLAGDPGGFHPATAFAHPWAIPLIAGAGALAAAALVFWVAPETQGHGTDAAISAIHHAPSGLRARATAVKMLASAVTIGSGGSGGSEGPTAQIAATAASVLARRLRLTPEDARTAVTTGLAAGVGAIFRAPLGGAMLGVELLYRDDMDPSMLVPCLIASFVSYLEFGAVFGFAPMFGRQAAGLGLPGQLVTYAVLGLAAGGLGRLYSFTFYKAAAWFGTWRVPRAVRPGIAGLATGLIGLAVPGVLGTGYGTIQDLLEPHRVAQMSVLVLLAIPVAKIAATSLSIGSGGSGGVFGPGLVMGAGLGAALWRILEPTGLVPASPAPMIIVGMAACLGSAAHAPISIVLIAAETTGSIAMVAPAGLAVALAVLVVGRETLYRSQPVRRGQAAAAATAATVPRDGQPPGPGEPGGPAADPAPPVLDTGVPEFGAPETGVPEPGAPAPAAAGAPRLSRRR